MNIVYILSPEFACQLYVSLRSLFVSGTEVENVTVFSIGGDVSWDTGKLPVVFRNVPKKNEEYWLANKTYISEVESEEIVFLDTDTIIQEPLGYLTDSKCDVIARRATASTLSSWDESAWEEYLADNGVSTKIPVLNAGLLVFRGGIHRGMGEEWSKFMLEAWRRRLFGNGYHADQWSLPVALGRAEASYSLLGPKDHAFAWEGDDPNGATVYHTGASNFFRCVRSLEKPYFLGADLPIPSPNVTWHYVKDRLKRKWESIWAATPKIAK